jgi:outer membrane protein OmpA-like peptidoglycan-associated protein
MVQKERNFYNNWLLWLIIIVIIFAVYFFMIRNNDNEVKYVGAASDSSTIESQINNNWTGIDPNIPISNYEELRDTNIQVKANDDYAIYSLKEAILFKAGKSLIGESGAEKLKQISASAEKRFAGGSIIVIGYTDSTGTKTSNQKLASDRAQSVKKWLIDYGNINEKRISVKTEGESNPISSNTTAKGRLQNRRVDIIIKKVNY